MKLIFFNRQGTRICCLVAYEIVNENYAYLAQNAHSLALKVCRTEMMTKSIIGIVKIRAK